MPRIARIIAPGYPHHITQRGNNRAVVFFDDEDRQTYLTLLTGYAEKYALQLWAYCLMPNHVHILAVPDAEDSLARGVGLTNQVYTQYLNRKHDQSGRLWQNRFFSCIVEQDKHLWAVARYIERNPLKSGLVKNPEEYRWSSARAHVLGEKDPFLTPGSPWLTSRKRNAYAEYINIPEQKSDDTIRCSTRTGRPFGSGSFIDRLEILVEQPLRPRKPGRPPNKPGSVPL